MLRPCVNRIECSGQASARRAPSAAKASGLNDLQVPRTGASEFHAGAFCSNFCSCGTGCMGKRSKLKYLFSDIYMGWLSLPQTELAELNKWSVLKYLLTNDLRRAC